MTSPVGHSLGGYIFSSRGLHDAHRAFSLKHTLAVWAFILFAANAPDLDFLYGALMGDMNHYHRRASHSLFAVIIFAGLVALLGRAYGFFRGRIVLYSALAYASHLVLDYFTKDNAAPFGMQLYWPFDAQYYLSAQPIFERIAHGGMGAGFNEVLQSVFSAHNLTAISLELSILGPIALGLFIFRVLLKRKT